MQLNGARIKFCYQMDLNRRDDETVSLNTEPKAKNTCVEFKVDEYSSDSKIK